MGCDIHAYIDVADNPAWTWAADDRFGRPSNFAELDLDRDYVLFALLADVRNRFNDGKVDSIKPKGLPDRVSNTVEDAYYLRVNDDLAGEIDYRTGYVSRATADEYGGWRAGHGPDSAYPMVAGPDWHSATWLTAAELTEAQRRYVALPIDDDILEHFDDQDAAKKRWDELKAEGYTSSFDEPMFSYTNALTGRRRYTILASKLLPTRPPHRQLAAVIAAMQALDGGTPGLSRFICWFDN